MSDSVQVVEGFGQDSQMQDSKLNIVGALFYSVMMALYSCN